MTDPIRINRAPVLTLWGAVVAERLGLSPEAALTAGQALAGTAAHAKGVRLGIYGDTGRTADAPPSLPDGVTSAQPYRLLGCHLQLADTAQGQRVILKGEVVRPEAVAKYLRSKFGPAFEAVRAEMVALAAAWPPEDLNAKGFRLYERFRPEVPSDEKGWGAKGVLDVAKIRALLPP